MFCGVSTTQKTTQNGDFTKWNIYSMNNKIKQSSTLEALVYALQDQVVGKTAVITYTTH